MRLGRGRVEVAAVGQHEGLLVREVWRWEAWEQVRQDLWWRTVELDAS